jgi:hypothetical protein
MNLAGVWACGFCASRIEWTMSATGPAKQIAPRIPFSWWSLPAPDRRLVCDEHLLTISGGPGSTMIYRVDGVNVFNDVANAADDIPLERRLSEPLHRSCDDIPYRTAQL